MCNNKYKKIFKFFIKFFLIILLLVIIISLSYYLMVTNDTNLKISKLPLSYQNIQIFDRFNNDITSKYYSNIVLPDEIPDNIKMAFLVTEDREFYNHKGIDYHRLIGALVNNIKHGDLSQGGSTITQQLVKNTHLTSDKNLNRKIKEFKIAKQIENNFSKDEILSMYLNILYFGNGIYGIKNASKVFFDKNINELNLSEACMLAGVVKNPSRYSPIIDYNSSNKRKNIILNLLYKNNIIDNKVLQNQLNYRISIINNRDLDNYLNSYLTNAIYESKLILGLNAIDKLPKNIKIYTNVDVDSQKIVYDIVQNKKGIIKNNNGNYPNNAVGILDNNNANVIAFSSDYNLSQYQINRQMGSLIKPFIFLNALENKKLTVATPILDEPINIEGYSPNNYHNIYHGYVNMRESLMHSYNIPVVKTLNMVGINNTKDFLKKLNFNISENDGLAIALGGFTVGDNLLDIAASYTMLANNGIYYKPSFVNRIIVNNCIVYNKSFKYKVCSNANAYIITDCLKNTVKNGTMKKLSYLPYEVAGKTGTVASKTGNSDCYSVAYTSLNTVFSWQGNLSNKNENALLNENTGGSYPTSQVSLVFDKLYSKYPSNFVIPEDIVEEQIDSYSLENFHELKVATNNLPSNYRKWEIFSIDNIPIEKTNLLTELANFKVKYDIENDNIKINIDGLKDVNYDIYKINMFNKKYISTIKYSGKDMFFIDKYNQRLFSYKYMICPYILDEFYNKIYLKEKYIKIDSI